MTAHLTTRERFALQKLAAAQPHFMKRAGAAALAAKAAPAVLPLAERIGRGVGKVLDFIPHRVGRLFWGGVGKATGAGLHASNVVAEHAGRGIVDRVMKNPGKTLGAAAMLGGTAYHLTGPHTGKLNTLNEFVNFGPIGAADQVASVLNPYGRFATENGRGLSERAQNIVNAPVRVRNNLMEGRVSNVVSPQIPGIQ